MGGKRRLPYFASAWVAKLALRALRALASPQASPGSGVLLHAGRLPGD
jgi:hypothetical protein